MGAEDSSDFVGVVVAAGRGVRFGGATPKQFLELHGRPLVRWAVDALAGRPGVRGVVAVLAAEELGGPRSAEVSGWPGVLEVVAGGETRADSVALGVAAAGPSPYVLVHDAARPLASPALVDAVIEATRRHGAALPAVAIPDTVKETTVDGWVRRTVDRSTLRLAQTPQGSRTDWLREALARVSREGLAATDEAAALELAGRRVAAVPGDPLNAKITSAEDLASARRRLDAPAAELRVGSGFDIHAIDPDRPLVLGGLRFEGEPGLAGHSDADVVLHAAMDALLGATAMGDIGELFPPGDPRYKDADSAALAGEVAARLRAAGWQIVNLDLTLLAERPRIRPRAEEMCRRIADCLGLDRSRIGIKATTLERLGALGRHEGMACQAVALVRSRGGGS